MAQAHDPSTLASLHPASPRELRYRHHRTSPRLTGSHLMTLRRPSRQPESGRAYVAGDPVNLVDWKAYARTDQLIVREVRDEATARVLIGVDVSETMSWPPAGLRPEPVATKAEVAMRVALNLAHAHLRMGDQVEIWVADDERQVRPERMLRPRGPTDLVTAFDRFEAEGFSRAACVAEFREMAFPGRGVDCAFWVGDGLGGADFGSLLALGKRSLHLHVLSSLELDIGWIAGDTAYFDEGAGRKEYQGQVLRHRDNYLKHLAGWRQKLGARQRKRGGEYVTLSDRTPIAQYQQELATFIKG